MSALPSSVLVPRFPRGGRLLAWSVLPLTAAVFLVPAAFVALRGFAGEGTLTTAVEHAFVRADLAGRVADSTALAELVALWREFHVVKAALAVLLVLALVALARQVRDVARGDGGRRRRWLGATAYSGVLAWLLGALTVLLANLQGAAAPLASVASFLPPGGGGQELAEVQERLALAAESAPSSRVTGVAGDLLRDFTWYHAVFAVLALVTGAVLVTLAARAVWRRWRLRGRGRSAPSGWLVHAGLLGAGGAVFLLLALANVSTWLQPVPALVASLGGGG